MTPKTSRASNRKIEPPLPIEALLRTAYEPPKMMRPSLNDDAHGQL